MMTNSGIKGNKKNLSPLKILLVTYSAYPRIGGRSTYITLLKKKLEEQGHTVDLLAHKPGLNEIYLMGQKSVDKEEIRLEIEQKVRHLHQEHYPHLSPWIRWRELERYIFEEALMRFDLSDYDLVHTQDIFSSLICPRIISNKPIIASFHNCKVEEWKVNQGRETKSEQELEYIASEEYLSVLRPQKVIVPSRWLKNAFVKLGVPETQCTVIPYGLEIEAYNQKLENHVPHFKEKQKPIILVPARMVPIKGHTFLFQALERLKEEDEPFECWLAGNGVLEEHLRQEAQERQIDDRIHFLGGRHDIPTLLAEADMMVLPTLHDTFPFVVMEAQAAGVPVISTAVGGVVEMIAHGKTGLLGPPGDAHFLYQAIKSLIHDPKLRHEISINSRHHAERCWNVSLMIEKTVDVYQQSMESWREEPPKYRIRGATFDLDHELLERIPRLPPGDVYTGKIVGKIDRSSHQEGRETVVHLMDISWITLQSTRPDREGYFTFEDVPPGRYALMVVDGDQKISGHTVVYKDQVSIWNVRID